MNTKLLTLTMALASVPAFAALDCTTDSECFSQGLKLIREGKKFNECIDLVNASAEVLTRELTNDSGQALVKLDTCIQTAKLNKAYNARVKKINAALGAK